MGHQGWKQFWSQSGWEPGTARGSVACGEYVMVPPGLVTAMCVFPFISSETCHIMGLNTSYINSGTETKQTAQTTADVILWCGYAFKRRLDQKQHFTSERTEKRFSETTVWATLLHNSLTHYQVCSLRAHWLSSDGELASGGNGQYFGVSGVDCG